MLSNLISRPCTVIKRSQSDDTDRYGDEIPGTSEVETLCEVQQRDRSELNDQALGKDVWNAYFFATEDLTGADALIVPGVGTFEFDGPPWKADSGPQSVHHIEATVVRVADEEGS